MAVFSVAAIGAVSVAKAEQAAPVDYDCALFNECGDNSSGEDRGKTKGFSMAGNMAGKVEAARPVTPRPMPAAPVYRPKAPAYAPAPRPVVAMPASAASGVDLQMTFFSNSTELTPGARVGADRLAAAMLKPDRLGTRFVIEGHTDAVGARATNQSLSLRRAQAVVDYLMAKGVDSSRFEVVGYGFDRPLPGVSPLNGANRRVVAKPIR